MCMHALSGEMVILLLGVGVPRKAQCIDACGTGRCYAGDLFRPRAVAQRSKMLIFITR